MSQLFGGNTKVAGPAMARRGATGRAEARAVNSVMNLL